MMMTTCSNATPTWMTRGDPSSPIYLLLHIITRPSRNLFFFFFGTPQSDEWPQHVCRVQISVLLIPSLYNQAAGWDRIRSPFFHAIYCILKQEPIEIRKSGFISIINQEGKKEINKWVVDGRSLTPPGQNERVEFHQSARMAYFSSAYSD